MIELPRHGVLRRALLDGAMLAACVDLPSEASLERADGGTVALALQRDGCLRLTLSQPDGESVLYLAPADNDARRNRRLDRAKSLPTAAPDRRGRLSSNRPMRRVLARETPRSAWKRS